MASHQFLLDAQGAAHTADLIFEKHPERFHDLQVHLFRKTAHIVVRLDLGSDTGDAGALNHIGIYGPLGKPAGVFNRLGVFVEGLYEQSADHLSFGFRLGYAGQLVQEGIGSVGTNHIQAHVLVGGHHVAVFVFAEQAVVHENTGELMANRLVQQHGGHRGVHAAAQAQNHLIFTQLGAKLRHRRLDEGGRCPVAFAATDTQGKV